VYPKDIDRIRLSEAIQAANLSEMIRDLPQGVDTVIGHNGNRLSGGQRQRLAIARAVYKNAPILILDEATNALEKITEFEIINSLRIMNKNITILIVTHRLSSLKNCDNIFVFDKGKLKETGKFDQLVKLKKYFNKENI
jgi:subfamily B ATP-binding cassette protein MsbA